MSFLARVFSLEFDLLLVYFTQLEIVFASSEELLRRLTSRIKFRFLLLDVSRQRLINRSKLSAIFGNVKKCQKGVVSLIIFRDILEVLANLSVDYHQNWAIGPTFHGGQFGPVTGPLAQLKMSDFDSITSYGSVQVSAAQICKNFENRYVRTRDMGKKLTENGHFWAQFWPNSCPV